MAHSRRNIEQATNGLVVALYVAAALFLAVAGYFLLRASATDAPPDTQGHELQVPRAPALSPTRAPSFPPALPLT